MFSFKNSKNIDSNERSSNLSSNNNQDKAVANQNIEEALLLEKYHIKQLDPKDQKSCLTYLIGNDPKMPAELDSYHEPENKIALVATSGLRAVSLACKIGNFSTAENTPKIILIDNSKEVVEFWRRMRSFMGDECKTGTEELFNQYFPKFLKDEQHLWRPITNNMMPLVFQPNFDVATVVECLRNNKKIPVVNYLNQDPIAYFKALIKLYTYENVRAVIRHALIVNQCWENEDVFNKIKNILADLKITKVYLYSSNIMPESVQAIGQFIINLKKMNPVLSIITDGCNIHKHPEHVYLLDPKKVDTVNEKNLKKINNLSSCCRPSEQVTPVSLIFRLFYCSEDQIKNVSSNLAKMKKGT